MPVRVFVLQSLRDSLTPEDGAALISDFRVYKSTGALPDSFGRDVPYHLPKEAVDEKLFHLHLNDGDPWPIHAIQFNRTSDSHLVYCEGYEDPDAYALIAILSPDAHAQAKSIDAMKALAEKAEEFRQRF